MSHFRPHELEVLRILLMPVLGAESVETIGRDSEFVSLEHTGVGYFLTVRHASLPKERLVCSEPILIGTSGQFESGFVVFLENGELTLECHTWGNDHIPVSYREGAVAISQPNKSLERTREG